MTNMEHRAAEVDDLTYAQLVGKRLRAIRKQKRLSLQEVELESSEEFKASVLGAYERGERAISVPRLQRLAKIYRIPVDQLLPNLDGSTAATSGPIGFIDLEESTTEQAVGSVTIDLQRLLRAEPTAENERLANFLQALQLQRGDFNGRMLTLRRDDVWALGAILDTAPEEVSSLLSNQGLLVSA